MRPAPAGHDLTLNFGLVAHLHILAGVSCNLAAIKDSLALVLASQPGRSQNHLEHCSFQLEDSGATQNMAKVAAAASGRRLVRRDVAEKKRPCCQDGESGLGQCLGCCGRGHAQVGAGLPEARARGRAGVVQGAAAERVARHAHARQVEVVAAPIVRPEAALRSVALVPSLWVVQLRSHGAVLERSSNIRASQS